MKEDTIAAVTTAAGAAGIGVIRVSGEDAAVIADRVFRSKRGIRLQDRPSHTVTYGRIVDAQGWFVDECLALSMQGPQSFTGENIIELQCHGGTVVLTKVLELVLSAGARLAEPGEFSKRAFLHGRMDLSQAEAVMDLISAKTEKAAAAASGQLSGALREEVSDLRAKILEIIAYLEAEIDFPEEDIEKMSRAELQKKLTSVAADMERLLETFQSGKILREGLKTVLAGRPNVGKSSLLNALLQEKRAIVTDVPGTTRDVIEEYYNLGGIPVILTDTAGIRETGDLVERLGVEKTREALIAADLILYVLDLTEEITPEELQLLREMPQDKLLILVNKHDLLQEAAEEAEIRERLREYPLVFVSARDGSGLDLLKQSIRERYLLPSGRMSEQPLISNVRQKDALTKALQAVRAAFASAAGDMPADFISIDLRQVWLSLGEITGETVEENIIDEIFSKFCLGK
ncbi:MAG: tRNA uridine-5-carboxymethylaminomethyl(34) synthesis GTPase MnmE [Clostridia bacterium]|nr:tRNA uridine-5-carboxymethylaminomethyl(34) synthesis GTPase MnmE [Clostridia bacterium]